MLLNSFLTNDNGESAIRPSSSNLKSFAASKMLNNSALKSTYAFQNNFHSNPNSNMINDTDSDLLNPCITIKNKVTSSAENQQKQLSGAASISQNSNKNSTGYNNNN